MPKTNVQGFDFTFLPEGEITTDPETHDIQIVKDYDLKTSLAYNRIKSVTNDWFMDHIGANLESLIGRPCTIENANVGRELIIKSLTFDDLWSTKDIYIDTEIKNNTQITYSVYLRIYRERTSEISLLQSDLNIDTEVYEDPVSFLIEAELDLVKGVYIRYGWYPKRRGDFAGIDYGKNLGYIE